MGDSRLPSSSSPAADESQRSAERTTTKRRLAIIGTVRAAAITRSTSASPAVNLSSLNAAMPPARAAVRSSPTT